MNQISEKQLNEAEKQFKMFEALINSMTPEERSNPDLLAKVCPSAHVDNPPLSPMDACPPVGSPL